MNALNREAAVGVVHYKQRRFVSAAEGSPVTEAGLLAGEGRSQEGSLRGAGASVGDEGELLTMGGSAW